MNCQQLAARLSSLQPELAPSDVARLCLLIFQNCPDPNQLSDEAYLMDQWRSVAFRLEIASQQHLGLTEELENWCKDGPMQFSPDQLWTLIRGIKVQSNYLDLYIESNPAESTLVY